jgi:hypothetical protein
MYEIARSSGAGHLSSWPEVQDQDNSISDGQVGLHTSQHTSDGFADSVELILIDSGIGRTVNEAHLNQNGWAGRLIEEE